VSKKLWQKEHFKEAVAIIAIIAVVLGLFVGLEFGLHTTYPALTVISPSMFIAGDGPNYVPSSDSNYDTLGDIALSLTHPFQRTLSVGDIVIVQGVNPKDLNTNYPNSDIIIFHSPIDGELIVHRIISEKTVNGVMYFQTKGDGNGGSNSWPQTPTQGLDPWDYNNPPGVPQQDIVGKVIMRIPWFGWITIIMRDTPWGIPAVIAIVVILIVIEFVLPSLRQKPKQETAPPEPAATQPNLNSPPNAFFNS
jgi:hypothetical protein